MTIGSRYISPDRFLSLLVDLRLIGSRLEYGMLEFAERQQLLLPVARIRWPISLVLEERGRTPESPPTQGERQLAKELSDALHNWEWDWSEADARHPLDRGSSCPGSALVTFDLASQLFQPWRSFRVDISLPGDAPLYVDDAVDTFYHGWQALLMADILEMGMKVIFDTRRREFTELALSGDIGNLPSGAAYSTVSLGGGWGLDQGLQWAVFLDAAGRFEATRARKLASLSMADAGKRARLKGAQLLDYETVLNRAAKQALAEIQATPETTNLFISYLCKRWEDWKRRGRAEMAAEYERHIRLATLMATHGWNQTFDTLAAEIGIVAGGFKNTLDTIFPDWTKTAREQAELSLRIAVIAKSPTADTQLTLRPEDAGDLLDWLERRNFWKVHLSIEAILARQFPATPVDRAALAKEVEAISTTFEHAVNAMLDDCGILPTNTLMKKLQRLTTERPEILAYLTTSNGLASTKPGLIRATQLANIAALPAVGLNTDVARTLLAAVLYRNDGQHNSMAGWAEEELYEATRIFLTAMMFCRKVTLISPPIP